MKILDKHNSLFFFIYIPLVLLSAWSAYYFNAAFHYLFRLDVIFLGIIALFALLPQSKIKSERALFSYKKVFLFILLLQILFFSLSGAIHFLIFTAIPNATLTQDALLEFNRLARLGEADRWLYGVFPWGFYTACAATLMVVCYCQKKGGRLSRMYAYLFQNTSSKGRVPELLKPNRAVSVLLDFSAILLIFSAFVLTFSCVVLLFGFFIQSFTPYTLFMGKEFFVLLYATLLLIVMSLPLVKWLLKFSLKKEVNLPLIVLGYIILFSFVLFGFSHGMQHFLARYLSVMPRRGPSGVNTILNLSYGLMNVWWLSFTPLIAGTMAYLSQGHAVRKLIFGALVLPVGLTTFQGLLALPSVLNVFSLYVSTGVTVIAFFIMLKLFFNANYIDYVRRAILPGTQTIKSRSAMNFLLLLFRSTTLLILLFLPTGVLFPVYVISGVTIVPLCFFVAAVLGSIVITVWKDYT